MRLFVVVWALLLLTGCGSETASVPLGTWKDVSAERYMTIEQVPVSGALQEQYVVTLFTYKHRDGDDPATSVQTAEPVLLERSVPAAIVDGQLTLEVGATNISVLFHPNGERILVNGTSEFVRVVEPQA